jgi:hypothetical protein
MFCRSTWVIFSWLEKIKNTQLSIFDKINKNQEINKKLIYTINFINFKYNSNKICFWTDLLGKDFESKLGIRR